MGDYFGTLSCICYIHVCSIQGDTAGEDEISAIPAVGGNIQMLEGYTAAGPLYRVREKNKELKKTIKIKMDHCANLETDKDCESMAFLRAQSISQEGLESSIKLDRITGHSPIFKRGEGTGEITIREMEEGICIAKKKGKPC